MSPQNLTIPVLLRGLAVAGAVAMSVSLFTGFLDPLLIGTWHGGIGMDYFSVPQAWLNLLHGQSIYAKPGEFGPYASWYPYHPALAILVGSWTAMLPEVASYLAFVFFSLGVLWLGAALVARRVAGEDAKALAFFAVFAAPPTYVMLWDGQMHVFTVLATACLLAGLMDAVSAAEKETGTLCRDGLAAGTAAKGTMLTAAGLLLSLLSKPLLLLLLPLLVLLKETRRAACAALLLYVYVSLAFLLIPELNPGGHNGVHWSHIWQVSGADRYTAPPSDIAFRLPECARELFSLAGFLNDLFPFRIPTWAYHLPLAAVLVFAVLAARRRDTAGRAVLAIVAAILGIQAYYLGYTIVWEYHYTTLLPTIPVLWWLYRAEARSGATGFARAARRCAAASAFWSSACVLLPTLYFLFPADPGSHPTLGKLLRVVPTALAFVSLAAYGALVAAGGKEDRHLGGERGAEKGETRLSSVSSPLSSLPFFALCAALVATVLLVGAAWPGNRVTVCLTGDEESQCRKEAEVLPHRPQLWVAWAEQLFNADRYDEAAKVLETCLRRNPDFAPAHQMLARVARSQGNLPRAVEELHTALRLDPRSADCHADLGAVRFEQGDVAEARRESLEALRLDPQLGEPRKTLSLIRVRVGT
jgi:tetratricopeptide (TPR) repeat protein